MEGLAFCNLEMAEIILEDESNTSYVFDTATEGTADPKVNEGKENVFRIKNRILAATRTEDIVEGFNINLNNSTFIPEVLAIIDGGELKVEGDKVIGYKGAEAGSVVKRKKFTLNLYTAEKDTDGETLQYAKFSYPSCTGTPVKYETKDGTFFVPKFTIKSRPKKGKSPVDIDYVTALPEITD